MESWTNDKVEDFVQDCRSTTKLLEKEDIMLMYDCPILREMLFYCYEPFIMYNLNPPSDLPRPGTGKAVDLWDEFKEILTVMNSQQAPKRNKELFLEFMSRCNRNTQDLFSGIVRNNLKTGFGIRFMHKIFPGLITKWNVALANRYETDKSYLSKQWLASRKLDGIRLVCTHQITETGLGWKIRSRKGKDLTHEVAHLIPSLEELRERTGHTFCEGEGYKHGVPFETIQGDIIRQSSCDYIQLRVFTLGSTSDFLSQIGERMVIPREEVTYGTNVVLEPHYLIPNEQKRIFALATKWESEGYEGAILRNPTAPYSFRRNDYLLKVKMWLYDDDGSYELTLKCLDIEGSDQMRSDGLTKSMIEVYSLKHIVGRDPDGIITNVGGGKMPHPQRDEIWENRDQYIGRFFDIALQRTGSKGAAIFPVFQRWREESDVDFEGQEASESH